MSDDPIKRCPECGKRVRRLIGGGLGVIFKGSGFYVTDNKRSANGAADRHGVKSGTNGSGDNGTKSGSDGKNGSESKNGSAATGGDTSSGSDKAVRDSV